MSINLYFVLININTYIIIKNKKYIRNNDRNKKCKYIIKKIKIHINNKNKKYRYTIIEIKIGYIILIKKIQIHINNKNKKMHIQNICIYFPTSI